ncbi:MAG: ferritin-like domain-containing protein [Actinobacteria bacterium]|nr:ferritin-like domain-containing protein [Actinomycetota bacterium]
MAPNGIMRGGGVRRGRSRAAAAGALLAALALVPAGCGGGTGSTAHSTTAPATTAPAGTATTGTATNVDTPMSPPEPTADGVLLDKVLAREEAAIEAYGKVIPQLSPRLARLASYFRAQEQEHVDAVLKAMRGIGSPAEPSPEPLEPGALKTDRERLEFLYEVEGASIDEELSAISELEASWPRSLLASVVADQGEHLTLLRQELGAGPLASVPVPFENGTAPPPE